MASALGTPPKGGETVPHQTSAETFKPVGSGARPGTVKIPIETSAPADEHTQGRAPPGWLK